MNLFDEALLQEAARAAKGMQIHEPNEKCKGRMVYVCRIRYDGQELTPTFRAYCGCAGHWRRV